MSFSDEDQKSLEEILEEHLSENFPSFHREELLSEEVQGEMDNASLSFDSLMQMQKRLTEVYHNLISKKDLEK